MRLFYINAFVAPVFTAGFNIVMKHPLNIVIYKKKRDAASSNEGRRLGDIACYDFSGKSSPD